MKSLLTTAEYRTFLKEIKERIHKSRHDAFKAVNKELINLYWDIGKSIIAKQKELGWGKSIVETLAKDLQKEFPGIQGFSARNLWNMRTFYLTYKEDRKLQPLVAEISWTKNVIIMERCKDDVRREFYIKITKKFGWKIVEYALKDTKKPIGVSTYKMTEKLPCELKKYLPSPEEMIERINYLE
jgi:predicted nuclease of restriction endonuclease-like (RecB) superfamily